LHFRLLPPDYPSLTAAEIRMFVAAVEAIRKKS
jgi:hypothetical protein